MAAGGSQGVRRGIELRRLPLRHLVVAALLPLVLLAAWLGVVLATSGPAPGARIGEPAPAFALADLDGNPVSLDELRGRPVLVNFWASWCGPCVDEFPALRDAMARHAASDLAVIGVVFNDHSEDARAFMARMGATWPAVMDPGGAVAERYAIFGPPETFFIGRDGVVAARQIGPFTPAGLEEKLAIILEE